MIEEYLLNRYEVLNDKVRAYKEKFEHNQISIVEINNQINELNSTVDEASQIFSVKAREDNGFRKQEIVELERKIAAYVSENKDYEKIIMDTEKEIEIIKKCLDENNVSRETSDLSENDNQQLEFDVSNDEISDTIIKNKKLILEKLKLCKSIAKIDEKRVEIEIDNLIKIIEK